MTERAPWGSKRPYQREYQMQRARAHARAIDWQFTYDTWIEWWGDDIVNRGRSKGKLVMARTGDHGPYSISNCKKITHSENVIEAKIGNKHFLGKRHSAETITKICATKAARKELYD